VQAQRREAVTTICCLRVTTTSFSREDRPALVEEGVDAFPRIGCPGSICNRTCFEFHLGFETVGGAAGEERFDRAECLSGPCCKLPGEGVGARRERVGRHNFVCEAPFERFGCREVPVDGLAA
jgi:hypothetical protein